MIDPSAHDASAPLIVTATLGARDFALFDGLRRAHFPPERNFIPAHITLFHHLPPARFRELDRLVTDCALGPAPYAQVTDVISLGRGTAFRVHAPELLAIRDRLAEWFAADLLPQDRQAPRLHITIQNKVSPEAARALKEHLCEEFRPRPLTIRGLAIWSYLGGPWQLLHEVVFAGRRA